MQNSILQQGFILQSLWLPKYVSLPPLRPLRQGAKQVSKHAKHPYTTMKHNASCRFGIFSLAWMPVHRHTHETTSACLCNCVCLEGLGLLLERHNKENGVTRIKEVVRGLGADISRQVCTSKKKDCSHLFRFVTFLHTFFFFAQHVHSLYFIISHTQIFVEDILLEIDGNTIKNMSLDDAKVSRTKTAR